MHRSGAGGVRMYVCTCMYLICMCLGRHSQPCQDRRCDGRGVTSRIGPSGRRRPTTNVILPMTHHRHSTALHQVISACNDNPNTILIAAPRPTHPLSLLASDTLSSKPRPDPVIAACVAASRYCFSTRCPSALPTLPGCR